MSQSIKNYGFVAPEEITSDQYVLGGLSKLPKTILKPDGDWSAFYPRYEPQFNEHFDSYGCTVWGTENAIETLIKFLVNEERNYSERYIYNIAEVVPPGADPHYIAETIREYGLVPDDALPMTPSYEEFTQPKPMDPKLIALGRSWEYSLGHEWVWKTNQSKDARLAKIKEALQYSPLGVSVTAWQKEGDMYVDGGMPNTHWCVLGAVRENGYEIFDSYDQSVKILSFDHNIQFCKRYALLPPKPAISAGADLWKRLLSFFKDILWK